MMEAVAGKNKGVAIRRQLAGIAVRHLEKSGNAARAPHLLGLRDAIFADVVTLECERCALVVDRKAARACAAAEIERALGGPAELAPHPGRPGQPIDQRALVVMPEDERMIEPGIPFP